MAQGPCKSQQIETAQQTFPMKRPTQTLKTMGMHGAITPSHKQESVVYNYFKYLVLQ